MSETAKVNSIDALREFRIALLRFASAANVAMADADGDMGRTLMWLENEQDSYWKDQVRKRHDIVERCKEAVRMKKLFKSPTGHTQSAVDEEKALTIALRRLDEAHTKVVAVKAYSRRLTKEIMSYKGHVQRFATAIASDIPVAVHHLDRMCVALEAYVSLTGPSGEAPVGEGTMANNPIWKEMMDSMARAEAGEAPAKEADDSLDPHIDFARIREYAPALFNRSIAKPGPPIPPRWVAGILNDPQRQAVRLLRIDRNAPNPQDIIVLAKGIWENPRVSLVHQDPGVGDSGWYVGPMDSPAEALITMTIEEFLRVRSDLTEILALPKGYLVIIHNGAIAALRDPANEDAWTAPDARAGQEKPKA